MFKWMPKNYLDLMEETQKHIFTEALYFIGDIHSTREDTRRFFKIPLREVKKALYK